MDPTQKATRLANAISEGINGGTFVVVACALPFAAARRLHRKARQLGGDFTEG